jgi:hypothetical protein
MKNKNFFLKALVILISLSLTSIFLLPKSVLALSWSTPQVVGSHTVEGGYMVVDSSDNVHMVYDYGSLDDEVAYNTTGTVSETIDTITNSRIAQRFTTTVDMDHLRQIDLQQNSGNLVGNIRIETDNAGQPSGNLVDPNAEILNVTLISGFPTNSSFLISPAVSPLTSYWLVFQATGGSGTFDGGTSGTADQCMYYNGSAWSLSANVENIYFKVEGSLTRVYYRNNSSGSWSTPVDLKGSLSGGAFPSIAVDKSDKLHVIFINESTLYYTNNISGSWSVPVSISGATIPTNSIPAIVTDSANNCHVFYYESGAGGFNLNYVTNSSGPWSAPVDIAGGGASFMGLWPSVGIDSSNYLHAAFMVGTGPTSVDVFYTTNSSGSWSPPSQVSTTTPNIAQMPSSLSVDTDGKVYIGYTYMDGGGPPSLADVYYANNSSGSWSSENVTPGVSDLALFPSIDFGNSRLNMAYITADLGLTSMGINYTYKENNSWSTSETVVSGANFPQDAMPICVLKYGTLHIAYTANDGSQNNIYYTSAEDIIPPSPTPTPSELPYTGK